MEERTTEWRLSRLDTLIDKTQELEDLLNETWEKDPWLPGSPVAEDAWWKAEDALRDLRDDVLWDRYNEFTEILDNESGEDQAVDDKRIDDARRYAEYRQDRIAGSAW